MKKLNSFSDKELLPGISIDCVIIGFKDNNLVVLLNKYSKNDKWMLPGGLIHKDESLDEATQRILQRRTGIEDVFLMQFHSFGSVNRIDIEENRRLMELYGFIDERLLSRFVSIGYLSLVMCDNVVITNSETESCRWFEIEKLPLLYGDHNQIVKRAMDTIRLYIDIIPLGYALLPDKFTISELRKIYEGILGRELDRKNFQKKMLNNGLIFSTNERKVVNTYPKPILYSFNKERIKDLEGIM